MSNNKPYTEEELKGFICPITNREHSIGYNAVDSGHGARPMGPQICLNCRKPLYQLIAELAQPPDHSGCLLRAEVEAAIGDREERKLVICSCHKDEKTGHRVTVDPSITRNNFRHDIRQKLGLSGSQEKE